MRKQICSNDYQIYKNDSTGAKFPGDIFIQKKMPAGWGGRTFSAIVKRSISHNVSHFLGVHQLCYSACHQLELFPWTEVRNP